MITLRLLSCLVLFLFANEFVEGQTYDHLEKLEGHYAEVTFIKFHPEKKILVSGDVNGQILVWDIESKNIRKRLSSHTGKITHLEFNSTGKLLLSAAYDGTCKVWNFEEGSVYRSFQNSSTPAYATVKGNEPTFATFTKNERGILFGGYNMRLHYASFNNNNIKTLYQTREGGITSGTLSEDGQLLFFGVNNNIHILDLEQERIIKTQKKSSAPRDYVCELNSIPNQSSLIAAWTNGGKLQIWNNRTNRIIRILSAGEEGSSYFTFSNDGNQLLTGNNGKDAILWNTSNWTNKQILNGHSRVVTSVDFSKENEFIATGSKDHSIILWQKKTTPNASTSIEASPLFDAETIASIPNIKDREIDVQKTITMKGNTVKLHVYDDAEEDGDILSMVFNGHLIIKEYKITKNRKILELPITQKENYLLIYAHNVGSVPPNTIAVDIEAEEVRQSIRLKSNMNTSAALKIILTQ